jgi:hypothetical protein
MVTIDLLLIFVVVVVHLNSLMLIEIDMDKIETIDDNNIVEDDMSMIDPRISMNAELKINSFNEFLGVRK